MMRASINPRSCEISCLKFAGGSEGYLSCRRDTVTVSSERRQLPVKKARLHVQQKAMHLKQLVLRLLQTRDDLWWRSLSLIDALKVDRELLMQLTDHNARYFMPLSRSLRGTALKYGK